MSEKELPTEKIEEEAQPEIRAGYLVALDKKGNFIFELVGENKGLVELLGLHQYAQKRVHNILDATQGSGDRLVQELGGLVTRISQQLERVVKAVVKPDNKLE